jgi:prepilin-type N-terminal cleavage/methylation domain-containing protein
MISDRTSDEREGGFTLVELIIAVALSSILIVAITTAFIATLRGTASAHDRLVASNGSHTFSTYFTADVESANPDLTTIASTAVMGCLTEPSASTKLLHLQWSERTTLTELRAFSVSYRILASDTDSVPGNDHWELVRYACSGSGNSATQSMAQILSTAALADHVVVDDLYDPSGATNATKATIDPVSRVVELVAYAAKAKDETAPFSYTFSGTMRTPEPAPRVLSIKRNGATTVPASTTSVAWTVTFTEDVEDGTVDGGDFAMAYTGGLSGASVTAVTKVTNSVYTVTASTATAAGQGTMALTLDDNDTIVADSDSDPLGGLGFDNGNYTGGGYTVDRQAPSVVVAQSSAQVADPTSSTPIYFTATFNEDVTGFDGSDVTYSGTAPAGATIVVTGSGRDYVIRFDTVPGTGSRTISPSIAASKATDSAGNGNTASTAGPDNTVTYDPSAPPSASVTISDIVMNNVGGGAQLGKLEKNDELVITFSDSIDTGTFCSGWTGSSLTVLATVTENGGNDVLTLTTPSGCTFNFGSVDLGSGDWVTSTTTFTGSGSNASKVSYTDSGASHELTITFGAGSGPSGVAASTPIYDADVANIRGTNGGSITNSPKTATGPSRF